MATTTVNTSKDASAINASSFTWNGKDNHHPVGLGAGSFVWRSFLYFPISFTGMVTITSAVLHLKHTTGIHCFGGTTATLKVDRMTSDWGEDVGSENTWTTDPNGYSWSSRSAAYTTSGEASASLAQANDTWYTIDITSIVQAWFTGSANYGVILRNGTSEASTSYGFEYYSRESGSANTPYVVITYTTNTAPNAPTSLTPTGNSIVNTLSPTLAGTFSDPDAGDSLSGVEILLYEDDGTTLKWDSGTLTASGTSFSKSYTGPALTGNTFYQWKARTKDVAGAWGAYSSLQRFKANSTPNAPTISLAQSPTSDILTLTPTFNVTHSDPDASDSQLIGYHIILETSGGTSVWDSGDVTVSARTTETLVYSGPALSWGTGYRWRARTEDSNGAWGPYSSNATFTTHTAGVPVSLSPTGSVVVGSITPTFSGSRASTEDSLSSAQIQVYDSTGVTLIWDSGTFTTGVTSSGFSAAYGGTALAFSTTYTWRARITSSVGGTSAWSSLQTFVTPNSGDVNATAPLGSGIASLTPTFTFTRTTAFNAYQIILYAADGTTSLWDSGTLSQTSATSGSKVYPGAPALAWNTTYQWKVRVSSDAGSTWGNGYTGLQTFQTDNAGVPTLNAPGDSAWLGALRRLFIGESLTGVTNGTSASTSLDTTNLQTGGSSLKIALSALAASGSSHTSQSLAYDLSSYGAQTPFAVWLKASSLTNISNIRLRFTFATTSDFAEYTVTPASTGWEQKTATKGTPVATGGTVNWANVTAIGIVVNASGGGSVTSNINVDDVTVDATSPSFDGTTFGGDSLTFFRVLVYAADQTTLMWDSGDTAGSGTTFSIAYAGATALTKGLVYFWQARYTKSTGPVGNYSSLRGFHLNATPSAPTSLNPTNGSAVADDLTPTLSATFADTDMTSYGDTPSMFEIEVYRNSDSALMHTLRTSSGLVAGQNSLTRTSEGTALSYEVEYKWRARYWDSLGMIGSWSSYSIMKPSQSPSVTITAPGATVSSPSFATTWTFSSPGGKGQGSYRVRLIRTSDSVATYDSGRIFSSLTTYTIPAGYLVNSTAYSVEVTVWDSDSLSSPATTSAFTTSWTAPSALTGMSATTFTDQSVIVLEWDITNLADVDFAYYQLYRKKTSDSEWVPYAVVTTKTTISYTDYLSGNAVSYDYKVTVLKLVPGDVDLESADSDIATAVLDADVWWVIGADLAANHSFELPVYDEDHTEPLQQEVFEPLGTNRKAIVRGKVLGTEGSLQVKWNSDEVATAKTQLDYIIGNAGPHILKSPFGDVWLVEFSGPAKKYAGGGHLGVTLGFTEVS